MVTDPQATRLDAIIVRRWLIAVSLASSSSELATSLSPVSAGAALVSADTAAEAILSILADQVGEPVKAKAPHEDLLVLATRMSASAGTPIPSTLARVIRLTHTRRNGVVHNGDDATQRDVEEAQLAVSGLLEVLSRALPALSVLPTGAGLLRAVASQIDAPDLAAKMIEAEGCMSDGKLSEAREAASIALGIMLGRVTPRLQDPRPASYQPPYRGAGTGSTDHRAIVANDRALAEQFDVTGRRLKVLSAWVTPIALGLPPADFARLTDTLGEATRSIGGRWQVWPEVATPVAIDLSWALATRARVVFRLWEIGSLRPGDAQAAALAQARAE
jgi:hypothetical protein